MMANYFYKTSSGTYSPAEIAIAKFSFEDGIYNKYQTFVNPGNFFRILSFSLSPNKIRQKEQMQMSLVYGVFIQNTHSLFN